MAELAVALGGVTAVITGGVLINWFEWQSINQGLLVILLAAVVMNLTIRPRNAAAIA